MERLTLNAPAKINIGLNIVSRRSDGFHNLETFFYPIYDLNDKLIFEKSNNFIFDSDNLDLIKDADNLILRAHSLIEDLINKKLAIKITLMKNIPIGAGLGGGSSDAAATLLGLNELFSLNIPLNKLYEMALTLGSDVPYFILAKPALGFSRGEILKQSGCYINNPILIINPGIHISTKEAFQFINVKENDFDYNYFLEKEEIDFGYISKYLKNDFEEYVFSRYEEIRNIKDEMNFHGSLFTQMSGTGSTVYGIYNSIEDIEKTVNALPKNYFSFISKY